MFSNGWQAMQTRSIVASAIALNLAWLVNSAIVITAAGAFEYGAAAGYVLDVRSERRSADGDHARADGLVSLGVVLSAIVVAAGAPIADPIIGLAIGLVILRLTWQAWKTSRSLSGSSTATGLNAARWSAVRTSWIRGVPVAACWARIAAVGHSARISPRSFQHAGLRSGHLYR